MCITDIMRPDRTDRWAVILAGGDGARLRPLTRTIAGDERPKQFCSIFGGATLLDHTLRRVALAVPRDRTMVVVTQLHEPFYLPLLALAGVPSDRLIVQPDNRGTAPAILYALLRIARRAPRASVAFFPSDHHFSDEKRFMSYVETAFEAAEFRPEWVTLMGVTPEGPEVDYGWIEPAQPVMGRSPTAFYQVRRFWEKPPLPVAEALMERGCLWNSFVMVGRAQAFLEMIHRAVPDLYEKFRPIRSDPSASQEEQGVQTLYSQLSPTNFSQEVLAARSAELAVLPMSGVGWSDWGKPHRVLSDLARMGHKVGWQARQQPVLHVSRQPQLKISTRV